MTESAGGEFEQAKRTALMQEAERMAQACRVLTARAQGMGAFHEHVILNLIAGLMGSVSDAKAYVEWMLSPAEDDKDFPDHIKACQKEFVWAEKYVALMETNPELRQKFENSFEEFSRYTSKEAAQKILTDAGIEL